MSPSILATKLYVPPPRPQAVLRAGLIERLNAGLHRRLTLISAPAGFGKTTLVSAWLPASGRPAAWVALDEGDSDPTRFLTYLAAALQAVVGEMGAGVWGLLQASPPPVELMMTALLNVISAHTGSFVLVLDDYHLADSPAVDQALALLVEHLPPQMHLVIATREDPNLPLARLRARDQLAEVRAADLRFTPAEAGEFLNQVMNLNLAAEQVAALEARTEGWIAGLQLAALSVRGRADAAAFVREFAGDNRYIVDYLVAEVLERQPAPVRSFLLQTAILNRLCGPLCDAVTGRNDGAALLEALERANLFVVPLDDQRRWYRYHHLFADLLRQRLQQELREDGALAPYHSRASQWFEDNGLDIEAFQHAAAAHDIARAVRLVEGGGMSLLFRGAVTPVLHWLASLPAAVLDAWPSLWVMYASALLFVGQIAAVAPKLLAAEAALLQTAPDDTTRDLAGHIASIRATLAVTRLDAEAILLESRRALDLLHPDNLPVRTAVTWMVGVARRLLGDRAAAGEAFAQAIAASEAIGHVIIAIAANGGLGNIQEGANQLHAAARSYRRALELAGELSPPVASEAQLGLARILYEWNDLAAAEQHAQCSLQLAAQMQNTDRAVIGEVFYARLQLAQGDPAAAAARLAKAEQAAQAQHFVLCLPEIAAAQVYTLLRQGQLAAAAQLAEARELPLSLARVRLAQGDGAAAMALLEPLRRQAESAGWADERLRIQVLQALALHVQGDAGAAGQLLAGALAQAEPEGFTRLFVDEGPAIAPLLAAAVAQGIMPDYAGKLLALVAEVGQKSRAQDHTAVTEPPAGPLVEPLSKREQEVLQLIAQGLSNQEIGERLFLALDTVKGHNRRIFEKLGVQRRTEAVAKARALQLLRP